MPRFLERDEAERAAPIEAYPWDGVKDLRLAGGVAGVGGGGGCTEDNCPYEGLCRWSIETERKFRIISPYQRERVRSSAWA